jgi:class 3 adenylate cyclase
MQAADDPGVEGGRFTASLIPGARFVAIPGSELLPLWKTSEAAANEIQRFAAAIRNEQADLERVLVTILFTDIVESTTKVRDLGDRAWRDLLQRHHAVVRAMVNRYRGIEVDTAGDGFFTTFDGPARAVRCAIAIREALQAIGLDIRAGLHTGEVETTSDNVAGLAVHIGARVASVAGSGEILVSSTVRDLVAGSGLKFEDAGEHRLKGLADPWRLYRVAAESVT